MLTPYLENLIHKGKARFRTFVCGQSGSNLLPVSDNTWIIITGFTYCNFSDPKAAGFEELFDRSIHQIRFRSSKSNNHYIVKDEIRRDPGSPGSDINLIVNGDFTNGSDNWDLGTGWSIVANQAFHSGVVGAGTLIYDPFNTYRGRRYRLSYEVVSVAAGGTVQPFLANVAGFIRSAPGVYAEEMTAPAIGQLDFRGNAGLGRDVTIDNVSLILLPSEEIAIINGHYVFDCYLPHQNEVSVELAALDAATVFSQISTAAPESLPLPPPPVGYGNAGVGGIAQVSDFRFDSGGNQDIDLPLTIKHNNPLVVPGDFVQNGMEIGISILTAINEMRAAEFAIRDFPIIDIQYVEIQGNMPGNIQAST